MRMWASLGAVMLVGFLNHTALATPEFVEHVPSANVFGEAADITQREPTVVREGEPVDVWVKIGYSFFYTDVAIYYTTDGSTPLGSMGVPLGTTQVLRSSASQVTFIRNEGSSNGNIDWWKATLPASTRSYAQRVRYMIGAWNSNGGIEVFANNAGCADDSCDNPANTPIMFEFSNKIAWPGQGSPAVDHSIGYPPVHIWKEEGVVGNNNINVMVDQNGSVYDIYYPSAGAVQGVSTRNEGYDAPEEFPGGIPAGFRGQMNLNEAFAGLRVDGTTYWLTNRNGSDYTDVQQSYIDGTNTISTTQRLVAGGNNILVEQVDFSPKGISYPTTQSGDPNKGIYVKRITLTNQGRSAKAVNVYYYMNPAINGGDSFDVMSVDSARGAMVAHDTTYRNTNTSGEYNPTFFSGYEKDVSIYLAAAMKLEPTKSEPGAVASDNWRDSSDDNGQGWIGLPVTLDPGESRVIDICIVGGFDDFAGATGTYNFQIAGVIDWFNSTDMGAIRQQTDAYWQQWLSSGVTVDLPDDDYDTLFTRGLLCTALHQDEKNGGLIAGYHNGAYPFVWPRDAAYGARTLINAGHAADAKEVLRWLRDVTYRSDESWGKGFWYQKYTTDGFQVWTAPQIDETAVAPWAVKSYIDATGDNAFLSEQSPRYVGSDTYKLMVHDAGYAMSSDSANDNRAYYDDTFLLMHGNNIWEDSFDLFIYTNANVVRGLRDAASLAILYGLSSDASTFNARADSVQLGVESRLDWNGENTDISLLGIVYPFQIIDPTSVRATRVLDRIRGIQPDAFGNFEPLVNGTGAPWLPEFEGLINRYWGDGYWQGGPWHLSTVWYGLFHMERADATPGKADIDDHKYRMDRVIDTLGPLGLGAEQLAPNSGLLYAGQTDFRLQTAWPNAWESMSTFVDGILAFIDFQADAIGNKLTIHPKLPSGWDEMAFNNLRIGSHRVSVTVREQSNVIEQTFANLTGGTLSLSTVLRVPPNSPVCGITRNGMSIPYIYNASLGQIAVNTTISGASVTLRVVRSPAADINADGFVNAADLSVMLSTFGTMQPTGTNGDLNGDGIVNGADLSVLLAGFGQSCPQ